jgi:uroporphyrinogen decarboxylase
MGCVNDWLRATLQYGRPEQICQFEWGYWPETIARWQQEGMPGDKPWEATGITYYHRVPAEVRIFPHFQRQVLEETPETLVVRGEDGVVSEIQRSGQTNLPRFIRHPVETLRDFETLKERLNPHDPKRYAADWQQQVRALRGRNSILVMGGIEISFFGWARDLMGVENLLMAFYDQPELIHAINRHQLYFIKEFYSKVLQDVSYDFIFCWEDMSFKNGPLISPELVRVFMLPYYRELVGFFRRDKNTKFLLDSDGDVLQLIPLFREVGIDGMLPFEVAAGMDIVKIAEEYPDLIICGGIDKREIAKGRKAIDAELGKKLPALFRRGGYLPTMDHHVPPEVSYADFQYYLQRTRELYQEFGK